MTETHNFFTFFVTLQRVTPFKCFKWTVWTWFFRSRNMWQCTVSFGIVFGELFVILREHCNRAW